MAMECNRDEASRAKEMAEKKMLNNDFEGARKIGLKARQLFPELDNISQLIAVCDVHCSAQRKIYGAEKDLYGILQVESLADEATIRKQYRKLALVLHPDKNKFPGAEAAFKLIGEANMILSDKGKRSVYDIKRREPVRASVTKLQNHQGNQNSYVRTQFGAPNKFNGVPSSQFNGAQGVAPGHHHVHDEMRSANLGSNRAQPAFPQQKVVGGQEKVKVNMQNGQFPSHFAHETCSSTGVWSTQRRGTKDTEVRGSSRSRTRQEGHINTESGKQGVTKPKVDAQNPRDAGISKGTNRKRERKMVAESGESSSDKDAFGGIGASSAGEGSAGDGVHCRRSSRQRQQVSYREDAGDDLSHPKRSRLRKFSSDVEDMQKEEVSGFGGKVCNTAEGSAAAVVDKEMCKQKEGAHADGSLPNGKDDEKHKVKGGESVILNDHSKFDSGSKANSNPVLVDCPDPEFSNFDKDKEKHCFAVDQIWACYDSIDGMPRFYAQVRRIYSSEFRLRITWLEAEPENHLEIKWAEEGLPVACGKFVRGGTEETRDRLMFSHQIAYEKGGTRFSYVIYPRKGEIWALFKDWDIKWCLDSENHTKYKFDIVEILSQDDNGVSVAYLVKVKGFVSLFQRTIWAGHTECKIPSSELFRFSHRIPSSTLTGTERTGVPTGSFELDTASLPGNIEEYYYSTEVNVEPENVSSQVIGHHPQSHEEKVKPTTGLAQAPKKPVNSEARNGFDNGMLKPRRSPRGLKGGDKNQNQANANPCPMPEVGSDQSHGVKDKANDSTPSKGHNLFCEDGDISSMSTKFTKSPRISSSSAACKKLEQIIHDFNADKQIWKFQVGQIWAFYRHDGIHECYAQIKLIESQPLRLHVAVLKSCGIPSKNAVLCDACGLFKVCAGRTQIFSPDSFSHIVKAEVNGKNNFNIYPREQEIWALHKRQDSECTGSDLEGGECDIVEVLETDESSIKVLCLVRVPGYKSVFKAPRIQRSMGRILVIPSIELNRFCHQVPAFLFSEEKDGCLRGCWELDPAALAGLSLLGPKKAYPN